MKTERLLSIVIYLLNHDTVSAAKLAERFEVSKRTILRDMEQISQAGIPIKSIPGTNGGYSIMEGFKIDGRLVNTEDQASIITALKGFITAYDNKRYNEVLEKVSSILPTQQIQHIFLDFGASGENNEIQTKLKILEKAIYDKKAVQISYVNSCMEGIPHGKRSQAFIRYAKEFGKQALIDHLRINFENGITYHTPDKTPGDYDILETADEIYQLLRYGRKDPYAKCPEFDTEHFHLRQVRMEDAEELLCFYGDLSQWMFYGNSWSNGIFTSNHPTLEEMQKCIVSWLGEYSNRYYIRFSVIDKATAKAIGTIEVFDNLDKAKNGAVLHIDLSAPYEIQSYITELLTLANREFFPLFGFKYLIVRAIPDAVERLVALRSTGYDLFESESREHYYMKERPAKIG